jgi:hypothetical protein
MEAALRENRIQYYRTKVAESQQEYMDLVRRSYTPDLTVEDGTAISRIKEETIERCADLQYMLGLYEYQCECDEV